MMAFSRGLRPSVGLGSYHVAGRLTLPANDHSLFRAVERKPGFNLILVDVHAYAAVSSAATWSYLQLLSVLEAREVI
jgi:hypothetical protein